MNRMWITDQEEVGRVSDTSQPNPNQPSQDWLDVDWERLPEDSPIFNGVMIFSPSASARSETPPEPEQPEATSDNEDES
jgi:hypothetical protein